MELLLGIVVMLLAAGGLALGLQALDPFGGGFGGAHQVIDLGFRRGDHAQGGAGVGFIAGLGHRIFSWRQHASFSP